jgi:hypothetical protein
VENGGFEMVRNENFEKYLNSKPVPVYLYRDDDGTTVNTTFNMEGKKATVYKKEEKENEF